MKIFFPVFFILALFTFSLTAQSDEEVLKIGDEAPTFSLPDLTNNYIYLRDYCGEKLRKPWINKTKHVVVISFFATWCAPCKQEIPYLEQLQNEFKGKDIKFFLIDVGEEREKLDEFLAQNEISLNILHDRHQQISAKFGANSLPRLVVVDKEGIVQLVKRGFKDGESFLIELRTTINKLLL
jgi:thiol-disulfide isomerase/thioredoxin